MLLGLLLSCLGANAAPFVSLVSPVSGTLLSGGASIKLQANASDPDGLVLKVEFYVDGTLLGEVAPAPFIVWWSNVVVGTYGLTAVAIDDSLERATSAVVTVTVSATAPRSLAWTPPAPGPTEWNRTALNWRTGGRLTVFHPGDSVAFSSGPPGPIFIGSDGVPMAVSPAAMTVQANQTFVGGDILTGSLSVNQGITVGFSNYSGSLSFPGGTMMQPATSGSLTYDVSSAPNGVSVHFGTGPISLNGTFAFQMASNRLATLENDVIVSNFFGTIVVNPMNKANGVARFGGRLDLGGPLTLSLGNPTFSGGSSDPAPHEWSGPVVLDQSQTLSGPPRNLRLSVSGNGVAKGFLLSGSISDGPGPGTNRLRLGNLAAPFLRLAGTNTYAHGTFIEYSPGGAKLVEVATESSLGSGDVEVDTGGSLRLLGSRNVGSNASVIVRGQVMLASGVKVRVSSLTLGPNTFTSGLFTGTNASFYVTSNGTLRLPAANLPPTVSLTNPVNGALFAAGDTITIQAAVTDVDSYITRVEFRLNGALFGVRTNTPFQLSLKNAPGGTYPLQAVAWDDDGGVSTSAVVNVTVAPRIDRITSLDPNLAIIEFNSTMNQDCVLQATDSLAPAFWTNITSFSAEPLPRPWRITNEMPAGVSTRFYRLLLLLP